MVKRIGAYEYPSGSGIKISIVRNEVSVSRDADRLISASHRVTIPARIGSGKRRFKQFKIEREAKIYAKEEWDNFRVLGEDFSNLSKGERKDAIKAWSLAKEHSVSLLDVVEFGIKRMCPEGGSRTVAEVVDEFVQIKERRQKSGDLKERSLRDARARSVMLSTILGESRINEISGKCLKNALTSLGRSYRTQGNYRSIWSEVFKFAKQRKYILDNPFDDLSKEDVKEIVGSRDDWNPPGVLSAKEAHLLICKAAETPELDLLAAVTLGLFCGIRTEEIKQLDWKNLNLEGQDPHVTIPREVAKKRRMRHVQIPPNATQWLLTCENRKGSITRSDFENDYQRRFRKLLIECGFIYSQDGKLVSAWKRNGMRHSFGTYHFALHGDPVKTSVQMGHKTGDDVLFEHYRSLASKQEAESYFSILPTPSSNKMVAFP
jgi:integrase